MRGRLIRWSLPLLLLVVAGAGAAMAATATQRSGGTVKTVKSSTFGTILVAANGRTLYRYTPDSKGVNRCSSNATCNKFWPALLVKPGVKPSVGTGAKASLVGTMKATHGMRQVTYAGFPLYRFAGDAKAGQTKGQGFESKWYVVNTRGALVRHTLSASTAPTTVPASTTSTGGGGYTWG